MAEPDIKKLGMKALLDKGEVEKFLEYQLKGEESGNKSQLIGSLARIADMVTQHSEGVMVEAVTERIVKSLTEISQKLAEGLNADLKDTEDGLKKLLVETDTKAKRAILADTADKITTAERNLKAAVTDELNRAMPKLSADAKLTPVEVTNIINSAQASVEAKMPEIIAAYFADKQTTAADIADFKDAVAALIPEVDFSKAQINWEQIKNPPFNVTDSKRGGGGKMLLKFLNDVDVENITNGQTLIWNSTAQKFEAGTIDSLPDQTGNNGKYLKTDGTTASWDTPAGAGDVVKVGTPVNNQVGVWTGDGTIEGDTALTFDTTTDHLSVTTSGKLTTGSIELGHASANTLTAAGGVLSVEGVAVSMSGHSHEGTAVLSTGEVGGSKFLREDGDGTSSWQTVPAPEGTAVKSTGEAGGTKFLREDGDGTCSWQSIPAADVSKVGTPADNQVGVWTGDGTIEGDANFTWDGAGTLAIESDSAGSAGATVDVYHNSASPAALDTPAKITFSGKDSAANKQQYAAIEAYIDDTTSGSEDATLALTVVSGGQTGIGRKALLLEGAVLRPEADDSIALGKTTAQFSDLFLAEGGVINWDNGDATLTQTGNVVKLAGAALETDGNIELGHATDTTISRVSAGVVSIEGKNIALNGTSEVLTTGTIELGAASDTTLARVSAGVVSIEGKNILTTDGGTLTGNITLGENTSIALDPAGSADGKYSGITVTGTGGTTIAFGDTVYLAAADSRWELTDASAVGTAGTVPVGIAVSTSTDGNPITVLLHGIIRADAVFPTFTVGGQVFLSETAGDVTQTAPTTTDAVVRCVGFALTADEMFFNPSPDHITHV